MSMSEVFPSGRDVAFIDVALVEESKDNTRSAPEVTDRGAVGDDALDDTGESTMVGVTSDSHSDIQPDKSETREGVCGIYGSWIGRERCLPGDAAGTRTRLARYRLANMGTLFACMGVFGDV
jgi:hypothetical protein